MRGLLTRLVPATVLLTLTMLALAVTPALAEHVQCGDVITQDTTLDSDLIDCPADGIVIGADNITLDLGGNTIAGDHEFDETLIPDTGVRNAGHSGVRIQNGAVREFDRGINVSNTSENRLSDLTVCANFTVGIRLSETDHSVLEANTACDNRGFNGGGLSLSSSHGNRVERNTVFGNELSGIRVFFSDDNDISANSVSTTDNQAIFVFDSDRNRVEGNTVSDSTYGIAVVASSENLVQKNLVQDNGAPSAGVGAGIYIDGADANRFVKNRVFGNLDGISMFGTSTNNRIDRNTVAESVTDGIVLNRTGFFGQSNQITRNSALRNGRDGIHSERPETLVQGNTSTRNRDDGIDIQHPETTIADNTANRNLDLGIEASPGVTDGGHNRARGNGNPLQCLNVFCR
jgi:large repetitive protein